MDHSILLIPMVVFLGTFFLLAFSVPRVAVLFMIPIFGFPIDVMFLQREIAGTIQSILLSGSIFLSDLSLIVLLTGVLVRVIVHKIRFIGLPLSRLLVAYVGIAILSVIINSGRIGVIDTWVGLFYVLRLVVTFLPYYIILFIRPDGKFLQRSLILYLLSTGIVALHSLITGSDLSGSSWYTFNTIGFFGSRIGLGIYLTSGTAIAFSLLLNRRRFSKVGYFMVMLVFIVNLFSLVFTHKRAVLLMILSSLGWVLFKQFRRRLSTQLFGLLIIMIFVLGSSIAGGFFDRLLSLDRWEVTGGLSRLGTGLPDYAYTLASWNVDLSIVARVIYWEEAIRAALVNPFGVGFFQMIRSNYGLPHNQFLQVWAEMGVIGLWVFLILCKRVFNTCRHLCNLSNDHWVQALGYGVAAGFFGMLVAGISEQTFHVFEAMGVQWLLIGLIAVRGKLIVENQSPSA